MSEAAIVLTDGVYQVCVSCISRHVYQVHAPRCHTRFLSLLSKPSKALLLPISWLSYPMMFLQLHHPQMSNNVRLPSNNSFFYLLCLELLLGTAAWCTSFKSLLWRRDQMQLQHFKKTTIKGKLHYICSFSYLVIFINEDYSEIHRNSGGKGILYSNITPNHATHWPWFRMKIMARTIKCTKYGLELLISLWFQSLGAMAYPQAEELIAEEPQSSYNYALSIWMA